MAVIRWERYPSLSQSEYGRIWLTIQMNLGLAQNTIDAYGRALEDFFTFSAQKGFSPEMATREHLSQYVHDLSSRPNPKGKTILSLDTGHGLSNATLQQRLTTVRLWYDYLMEENIRDKNPVGRGRYTKGKQFGGNREKGLLPRYERLPWVPNETEWAAILQEMKGESLRNRMMLALGYDAGLRREELCLLEIRDIDPSQRLVRIRPETTKNHRERMIPYSEQTGDLYKQYLLERRQLSRARGPLFLSASRRNRGSPISIWTWSKVVREIALRSGVEQFTTHTLRHLRLTDLAHAGWDIHEIATFAGHRDLHTTMRYIHLSGRELKHKLEQSMDLPQAR
jgi:integrase/recombinase XerD